MTHPDFPNKTTIYWFDDFEQTFDNNSAGALIETTKSYSAYGKKIAQRTSSDSTLVYLLQDHLSSTSVVTDNVGTVVSRLQYEPYGKLFSSNNDKVKELFTGQKWDASIDLYYYNARYYNPAIGRFTQADPGVCDISLRANLNLAEQLNPFLYCNNSPVVYTDPTGLFGWLARIAIAAIRGENSWSGIQHAQNFGEFLGAAVFGIDPADTRKRIQEYKVQKAANEESNSPQVNESRGKNRLPAQGVPGSVVFNPPGTSGRKYGADGYPEQDWNAGHSDHDGPGEEAHVHDYTPRSPQALMPGKGPRDKTQRTPTDEEADFWAGAKKDWDAANANAAPKPTNNGSGNGGGNDHNNDNNDGNKNTNSGSSDSSSEGEQSI